ncbi:hypothetical protein BAUCODRAFT_228063 [Baudoinia panamericana UAMH 10762]|uniref:Uncharacterized protein n=1 Tax=Baudoinia panamericana (strain UAMH 10762) TaxID=717646 RepID=M2MCM3_BAUPA|nr:uncharacterized protein BAUCODRAFT_228063 [Baudoinia panamericana UAMH 10762]EMC94286.1 hypothetical protein BAUCODRAFT_228063 [Baudoinia panamericana UAMH 10762]
MQDANKAWHSAPQGVQDSIRNMVTLDKAGNVTFIGATKNSQALENWVRTFANGKTYIGTGSWNGNKGNPADNAQSSAANGIRDLIITYNDGDATPTLGAGKPRLNNKMVGQPDSLAHRTSINMAEVNPVHAVAREAVTPKGPGIILANTSHEQCTYNFYDNAQNGNGWAVPTFDHPTASVTLKAGATQFVSLHTDFKGRIQRGSVQPATWVEFQIKAANDGQAWGDISLEMGCDGAATIAATDGSNHRNGFQNEIISGAPAAAKVKRSDGRVVLDTTQGYWGGGPNKAASAYEEKVVGQKKAYILGGSGTDMVMSKNNCLRVEMY